MTKLYEEMLEALRTSVLEIVAADPADRDAKLKKSFEAYGASLTKRLEGDLPLSIEEADPVSLLGDRLSMVHEAITAIEGGLVKGADHLSEDSLLLAKGIVEFGGLALHAAAADFAVPVEDEGDLAEGEGLYKIATEQGEILVKSALPEQAAVLTADPAETAEKLAEFFLEGLDWLGVSVRLAKKAPPQFARKGRASAEDEGEEGDEDEGEEGDEAEASDEEDFGAEEGDEEGYEGEEGDEEGGDEGSPLENIARLTSLALLELDAIKSQMGGVGEEDPEGGLSALDAIGQHLALAVVQADALNGAAAGADDGMEMDPEAGQGEDAMGANEADMPTGEGDQAGTMEEEAEKAAPTGALAKARAIAEEVLAKAEAAEKRAEEAEKRAVAAEQRATDLAKAAGAKPAAPKAATGVGATALSKSDDSALSKESDDERLARLQKMSPEAAAAELIKMAHQNPVRI